MSVELIPIRIPMTRGRLYAAVLATVSQDGLAGVGEGPDAESAVAMARLDLDARERGVPVANLLGGVRRRRIACTTLIEEERPEAVAAAVEQLAREGFGYFKLKAANAGGQIDLERLGAARWAGGPAAGLRLDLNGRRAATALTTLHHLHLELVEQPLPPDAPAAEWAALAATNGVTLAADESLTDRDLACQLAGQGTALAIKLARVGGPLAALSLAAAATGPVTLGSAYETGVGIAAALHVACALRQEPLACGLATRRLLESDITTGLPEGPVLELPEGPGLGVELDWEAVNRYRVDR
ncbi:MAG: hypothetical protein E6I08_15520 [Chloroflexi bacterium]|nr:MAG: hypothetical protein E6I08_15520 [Chloroflexota bacterium]